MQTIIFIDLCIEKFSVPSRDYEDGTGIHSLGLINMNYLMSDKEGLMEYLVDLTALGKDALDACLKIRPETINELSF